MIERYRPEQPVGWVDAEAIEEKIVGTQKKVAHRGGLIFALVTVSAAVVVLVILAVKYVTGPAEGTISHDLAKKQAAVEPRAAKASLKGQSVMLSYPGIFDQVANLNSKPSEFDRYMMGSSASSVRSLAVSVLKHPNLNEVSGYMHRVLKPDLYQEVKTTVAGEKVSIMIRRDKTEQTLFWAHKGKVLEVAFIGDNRDDLGVYMKVVTETVRWLN
jgi:hypothetical protein